MADDTTYLLYSEEEQYARVVGQLRDSEQSHADLVNGARDPNQPTSEGDELERLAARIKKLQPKARSLGKKLTAEQREAVRQRVGVSADTTMPS